MCSFFNRFSPLIPYVIQLDFNDGTVAYPLDGIVVAITTIKTAAPVNEQMILMHNAIHC